MAVHKISVFQCWAKPLSNFNMVWILLLLLLFVILVVAYWYWSIVPPSEEKKREVLKDKVVVITGASSGLGKACCFAFQKYGCKIVLCSRNIEELNNVKQQLEDNALLWKSSQENKLSHLVFKLDLADTENMGNVVQEIAQSCDNKIDILVNNAGVSHRGSILSTKLDIFTHLMIVNFFGQVALTKALLPFMASHSSGHIVGVGSVQVSGRPDVYLLSWIFVFCSPYSIFSAWNVYLEWCKWPCSSSSTCDVCWHKNLPTSRMLLFLKNQNFWWFACTPCTHCLLHHCVATSLPYTVQWTLTCCCALIVSYLIVYSSGSQTFSDCVPFVGLVLWTRTTLFQESQCGEYNSIKSLENHNWHKCNMKKMAVRKYYGHF